MQMTNEGQAFSQALDAAKCAPPPPTGADWLQFIVAVTAALMIALEVRAFFSWLLPALWAAAARVFTHQPKEQNT